MKKLLISGGAGFIGHHVLLYFLENTNYEIISLDRLDYSGDLNRIEEILRDKPESIRQRVKIVFHDLKAELNPSLVDRIGRVDIIIHMAAASHVTRSIQAPIEFVQDNVLGTLHLLEYARRVPNLERFVYFSTDEVFGASVSKEPFREHDRYNATNPYSASKAAAEELCVAYENTYKLPIYITHTMNVFGERQSPEKFVPMCIERLVRRQKLVIHYDANTGAIGRRSYLHAEDVADALLYILNLKNIPWPVNHKGGRCRKFNIASDEEFDNLELAIMISEIAELPLTYDLVDPNLERPGHDMRYLISGEYLRSLGWVKKRPVKESMRKVVEYTLSKLAA
jgi:dTDP-glucose 4,6-dehydratase